MPVRRFGFFDGREAAHWRVEPFVYVFVSVLVHLAQERRTGVGLKFGVMVGVRIEADALCGRD